MPFHKGEIERLRQQGVRGSDIDNMELDAKVLQESLQICDLPTTLITYAYIISDAERVATALAREGAELNTTLDILQELRNEASAFTLAGLER